jgi:hypothetical protein
MKANIGSPEEGLPGRLNLEKTLVVVAAQEDGKGIGLLPARSAGRDDRSRALGRHPPSGRRQASKTTTGGVYLSEAYTHLLRLSILGR